MFICHGARQNRSLTEGIMKNQISTAKTAFTVLFTLLILTAGNVHAVVTGAIFTTDSTCTGVNVNIFTDKGAVYIDGGPSHVGAAGLPPGSYYVQVTEPNGTVLGTSVGAGNPTPFVVTANGEPAGCYQLSAILIKQSNSAPGYDDTTNAGGEYKVWVSMDSTFSNSASKT